MNFVADYLATQNKSWAHDRSATIGASEIGQCARRVWFVKNAAAVDGDHKDSRGAAVRGDLIERHVWLPALQHWAASIGAAVLFAGDDQRTLTDGYLSATCDAIVIMPDGEVVLRECKSIDPRVDLQKAKAVHRDQVQVQLGVVAAAGEYQPTRAVIDYIDASFVDKLTSFEAEPDPVAYAAAKARSIAIMDAVSPIELRPEGKMAGGKECDNCSWASRCAHEQVASVPKKADVPLGENAFLALSNAVERQVAAKEQAAEASKAEAEAKEEIKEILRAHGARRFDAPTFGVSWSTVKGRESLDLKAVERAGIDLTPFKSVGDPSERLIIKKLNPEGKDDE